MFQFPEFPLSGLCVHPAVMAVYATGFPHSDITGSQPAHGSPMLFAVYHVLRRLLMPGHPPFAFFRFALSCGDRARPFLWQMADGEWLIAKSVFVSPFCAFGDVSHSTSQQSANAILVICLEVGRSVHSSTIVRCHERLDALFFCYSLGNVRPVVTPGKGT